MKKAALAFGLVVLTSVNVFAQEEAAVEAVADAVATPAAVEAAPAAEVLAGQSVIENVVMEGTILDGQMIDGSQDMTHTAAPAVAAPVADCGCGTPAPVADCGCAASEPAPVADCGCEAAPEPCCEAAPAPCCKRQRKQVVRTWISGLRARRNCCCN